MSNTPRVILNPTTNTRGSARTGGSPSRRLFAMFVVAVGALFALAGVSVANATPQRAAFMAYLSGTPDASESAIRPGGPMIARQRLISREKSAITKAFTRAIRRGELRIVRGFWVSNALLVVATPAARRALGRHRLVDSVLPAGSPIGRVPRLSPPKRSATATPRGLAAPSRQSHAGETPFFFQTQVQADQLWALGATGAGMKVGIVDTEIDASHPVFGCGGATWTQASPCGRVIAYRDFTEANPSSVNPGRASCLPACWHGTIVASALAGGAIETKVWGTAPDASLLFARAADSTGGLSVTALAASLDWLADPDANPVTSTDRPAVINGSWVSGELTLSTQVEALRANNILPVFGAGNAGSFPGTMRNPAVTPSVLAVGNVGGDDVVDTTSSRGCNVGELSTNCPTNTTWTRPLGIGPPPGFYAKPDVVAPGRSMPFACHLVTSCSYPPSGANTGRFEITPGTGGTSLSSPVVAGVALLLRQRHPSWTPGQVIQALRETALDLGSAGFDRDYGHGRIRAMAADAHVADSAAPSVSFIGPGSDASWRAGYVDLTWQVTPAERLSDVVITGGVAANHPGIGAGAPASYPAHEILSYSPANGHLVVRFGMTSGSHSGFSVLVSDEAGNTATSAPSGTSYLSDATRPGATISPTASVGQGTMTFSGTASDAHSGVDTVTITDEQTAQSVEITPVGGVWSYTKAFNTETPYEKLCVILTAAKDNSGIVSPQSDLNGGSNYKSCGEFFASSPALELFEHSGGGTSAFAQLRMRVSHAQSYALGGNGISGAVSPTRMLAGGTAEWDLSLPTAGLTYNFTAVANGFNGDTITRSVQIARAGSGGALQPAPPSPPPATPPAPPAPVAKARIISSRFSRSGATWRVTITLSAPRRATLRVAAARVSFSRSQVVAAGRRTVTFTVPVRVMKLRDRLSVFFAQSPIGTITPPKVSLP